MAREKGFWQLDISRQTSAAKGFMGACPQVREFCPVQVPCCRLLHL